MKKWAFYTAIFGDYDDLIEPTYFEKLKAEADFYCFTDNLELESSIFKIVRVDRPHSDPVKSNRYFKILSHKVLLNYDIVIYADANVKLVCESFLPFIETYLNQNSFAVFRHTARNCLYKEAQWVLSRPDLDKSEVVKEQLARYREFGFPDDFGLSACTYLLRRNSDIEVQAFNELWWKEVKDGSRRDQLSFDFVRWKSKLNIRWIPGNWANNKIGVRYDHKQRATSVTNNHRSTMKGRVVSLIPLRLKRTVSAALREWRSAGNRTFEQMELQRLQRIPNNVEFETTLLGPKLKANHRGSFVFLYREIFQQGVYEFGARSDRPYIIDCGVNIGLSVIYFKRRFPGAKVIGFEPDHDLYKIASENIASFGISDVELMEKGVWVTDGRVDFSAEGSDGGRITNHIDTEVVIKTVDVVRLSSFLDRAVDFLKIDIEGAELGVLEECKDKLSRVNQMFVEYHSFRKEEQHLSKLIAILEAANFRYSISSPKVINARPYTTETDHLGIDFLLNIYAYRN